MWFATRSAKAGCFIADCGLYFVLFDDPQQMHSAEAISGNNCAVVLRHRESFHASVESKLQKLFSIFLSIGWATLSPVAKAPQRSAKRAVEADRRPIYE
jgi:hypothetical protein